MRSAGLMNSRRRVFFRKYGLLVAMATGGLFVGLTLSIQRLSVSSENPIIGAVQSSIFALIMPGILGSMCVSGNAHAWYLWIAAAINGLIYLGLGCFTCRMIGGRQPSHENRGEP
jgi:hypothetical protein